MSCAVVVADEPSITVVDAGLRPLVTVTDVRIDVVTTADPVTIVEVDEDAVTVVTVGIQGPPGPRGLPGSVGVTFTFTQGVPSSSWVIVHNMGRKPSVTIVDSSDRVVYGNVAYADLDNLTLTFSAPFSGSAYLN